MIFSVGHFSSTPFQRTGSTDESAPALIYGLLDNPELKRFYLLRVDPYDDAIPGTVEKNFGTGISHLANSSKLWRPYLVDAFNVSIELFSDATNIGGEARATYGAINIAIGDEGVGDELTRLHYDGREFRLYLGGDPALGWTFNDYVEVFRGKCEEAIWDVNLLTLVVRDPSNVLDIPIQTNLYLGTGGDEGAEDIKGKPKPLCYGRPRNISPVLVDRAQLIYQLHDGPVIAINNVYDKGDIYDSDGDTTDLRAWTGISRKFKTDLSRGMFKLGSSPNGIVTADDIQGDSDSGTLREKQGELIKRILKSRAGFTDSQLDLASLAGLDASGCLYSIYIAEDRNITDILDEILKPRSYRTFDTTGRFRVGSVKLDTISYTLQAPYIIRAIRDRTPLPAFRISLGYAKNWTLMTENDIAVIHDELDRDFAINEWRRVVAKDDTVWNPTTQTGKHPRAQDVNIDTMLGLETHAQAETNATLALIKADRHVYLVEAMGIQFRLAIGQTIKLVYSKFNLSTGRDMIVIGITENTTTGITTLRLWG